MMTNNNPKQPNADVKILAAIDEDRGEIYATFHIRNATRETIAMFTDLMESLQQPTTTDH
jgi:hypothetical protein